MDVLFTSRVVHILGLKLLLKGNNLITVSLVRAKAVFQEANTIDKVKLLRCNNLLGAIF